MTIVQLSITEQLETLTNLEPFVYKAYPGAFQSAATFTSILGFSFSQVVDVVSIIDLLRSPGTSYVEQDSYADVVSQEASWYFDTTGDSYGQVFYIHMEHDQDTSATFLQGTAFGYSSEREVNIGGFPYLPLVKSLPSLAQSQDIVNYDIPSMISGRIELDNPNGLLDSLITVEIYGNRVNIFFLDDSPDIDEYEFSDLVQLAALSVDDYDFEVSSVGINIKDLREEGNVEIPTDLFSAADYPDIKESLINKPIPWVYGEHREIPLICTNGKAESGDVSYRAGVEMTSFGTPYVKDGDDWTAVTAVSTDTSTGEIVLAEADARNGTSARSAKLVSCEGIENDRSTDVIADLNYRALGTILNGSNYDLDEWSSEGLSLGPIALYLDEQQELYNVIADIQNGSNVGFRYSITAEGKRTIRIDSESRTPVFHVPNIDILDRDVLSVKTDADNLAAIVNIDYNQSYVEDEYLRYVDSSESETVYATYRQKPTTPLETLLPTAALAAERGTFHLSRFSAIRGVYEGTLMLPKYLTLRIYDLLTIEITPSDFVDIDSNSIEGRKYFGLKQIKILSVDPDIEKRQNTITGVIIGTARFPEKKIIEYDGGEDDWVLDDGDYWEVY